MKRIVLLIYQVFIWLPLFVVSTILAALSVTVGCALGGKRYFSDYPGAIWAKIVCIITLCRVKIIGKEKLDRHQSYVFVANHQGAYDIFLVYGYIGNPIKWVMKQSLRKIPFVGKACESAGFIFVDQSSSQAAVQSINEAKQRLKDGASVMVFPEGTRSKTGALGVFKKGAFHIALDLGLPIVPITINGSYDVMPIGSYFINPHRMEMIIHDPISTEGMSAENIREAAVNLRKLSEETKEKIYSELWDRYKLS